MEDSRLDRRRLYDLPQEKWAALLARNPEVLDATAGNIDLLASFNMLYVLADSPSTPASKIIENLAGEFGFSTKLSSLEPRIRDALIPIINEWLTASPHSTLRKMHLFSPNLGEQFDPTRMLRQDTGPASPNPTVSAVVRIGACLDEGGRKRYVAQSIVQTQ